MNVKNFIFINSHPIQYFAPLYKYLNLHGTSASCWYCSDETIQGHRDREFNTTVLWDVPILEGYSYRFFKNYSWKPSIYSGFFGLVNPGLILALLKEKKSIVVIHGWSHFTNVLAILAAYIAGHTVCLRGESPMNQEIQKGKINRQLKKVFLAGVIFRLVHRFLYIGSQNKAFYEYYGVKPNQLIFTPYAVDNDRFKEAAKKLVPMKKVLRASLGLPQDANIILFTAKFILKKRPLDLLAAFERLPIPNKCLVMVGDGELRPFMENYIKEKGLKDVYLTGFINQTDIVNYYASADIFVMCSDVGETWGLSVNEAMNFDLPLVVSSITGCSTDLVQDGKNGYVFSAGNVDELSLKITAAFQLDGQEDKEIVKLYSFETIMDSLNNRLRKE